MPAPLLRLSEQEARANFQFQKASAELHARLVRPSTQYKPKLMRQGDQFLSVFSLLDGHSIIGVGKTPEKAMLDFDRCFEREVADWDIYQQQNPAVLDLQVDGPPELGTPEAPPEEPPKKPGRKRKSKR